MKKSIIFSLCLMFLLSTVTATFAAGLNQTGHNVKATDMPYYPDDSSDGSGPYTDSDSSDDSGPDSTDSGDSWDSGSGGFADPDGSGSGVLF
ncbi:MAG: hypothetical protein PWR01_2748 [Clostridiales bacterium]|jgi:hypothetical protein|nr:hypothetical protein [Clostridiales bacterium]MDN5281675.1 hypothetical protein [Candidatus Ozemobacter sp.]